MLNRISLVIMLLMSTFSVNAQGAPLRLYTTQKITAQPSDWLRGYLLPAWKVPFKLMGGRKGWIELRLHHLAGIALLILETQRDEVVQERNLSDNLHKIINVLLCWEETVEYILKPGLPKIFWGDWIERFYNYVSALKAELTPYGNLRELGRVSLRIESDESLEGAGSHRLPPARSRDESESAA